MLYFRFDCEKEDFKGQEHTSVLYGHNAEEMAIFEFENEGHFVQGYYLNTYNKLQEQLLDEEITEEEYDEKFDELVKEFIKDEWTLNGCSCFELSKEGIEFSNNYKYDDRKIITIFEGEEVAKGHDGEIVVKCEKIVWQGNADEITDIFYDDDIEDKVEEVLSIIK
jgi:hypothetical protein